MPFHFCMDEVLMIMGLIPFIGYWFAKLHAWYHVKFKHRCHHVEQCPDTHFEHISEKDAEYLRGEPVPLVIKIPVKIEE